MDPDELLSTREASQILDCTASYITHLIREGRLKATKKGGIWLIRRADLDDIKPAERPVGRPRKKTKRIPAPAEILQGEGQLVDQDGRELLKGSYDVRFIEGRPDKIGFETAENQKLTGQKVFCNIIGLGDLLPEDAEQIYLVLEDGSWVFAEEISGIHDQPADIGVYSFEGVLLEDPEHPRQD